MTAPLASVFIAPKHNVTELDMSAKALYSYGYKDICLVLFYTLAAVIFHAVIQEYVLDVKSLAFSFVFVKFFVVT